MRRHCIPHPLKHAISSTHPDRRTTINDNSLPGHALRLAIRDDQLRNVIRALRFSQELPGRGMLLYFLGQPPGHPCSLDQSWRDAIYGHVGRQCDCQAVGEMDQGSLTGRVCNTAATGGNSGKRCNVDDTAHSVTPKPWCERARQQEWPAEVRLKDTIPNVCRQRVKRAERNTDIPSGIIDEDVDPPEVADYLVDAGFDRFRITLIQLYGEALPAQFLYRVDRRTRTTSFAHIGNGDICA